MDFDDIIIGSGLSALGTGLGLDKTRRVLVLSGPAPGQLLYYDGARRVPCSYLGFGGLGTYWHGVIPTGDRLNFANTRPEDFAELFHHFYPRSNAFERLGQPWIFVPRRPIRPQDEWMRLARSGRSIVIAHETAERFEQRADGVSVYTDRAVHRGACLWVCAGALHSPDLLDRSLGVRVSRPTVSDHVVCYLGLIDRQAHPLVASPRIDRTPEGIWIDTRFDGSGTGLCTLRPARFGFRRLDRGVEQRAVFGLPTGSAIAKILRCASAGLLAEALYNRFGLFPDARIQSAYAQVVVPDAHWRRGADAGIEMRHDLIRAAADQVRAHPPWPGIVPSRRTDIFLPAIHLHHSVDLQALAAAGVNTPQGSVQVVDASVCERIGPEHHSFKLMVGAFAKARARSES